MKNRKLSIPLFIAALGAGAFATLGDQAKAADHADSPGAIADPPADITDLFAWMSDDATKLRLVMNVSPFATSASSFGTDTQYVFHIGSSTGYGEAQTDTTITCQFYSETNIECWAGDDEYVEGDPSATAGISSTSGDLKVFAGLRDDPFFMELAGFNATVDAVIAAAGSLTFDGDGCPDLSGGTGAALRAQLQSGPDDAAASDTLAGANVLAIVIEVDKTVVNSGGDVLAIWGSTHNAQ